MKQLLIGVFIGGMGVLLIALFGIYIHMQEFHPTPCDPQEYQIRLEMDSTYIYSGNRFVGALPYDSTQSFDKLMIEDNR